MLAEQNEYETFLNNLNSFKGIEKVLTKDFQELNVSTNNTNERERSPNAIEVVNKFVDFQNIFFDLSNIVHVDIVLDFHVTH